MLCLAQYSCRAIPLCAKPLIILRISCLLRILPFSAASIAQSRWVPQTLTVYLAFFHILGSKSCSPNSEATEGACARITGICCVLRIEHFDSGMVLELSCDVTGP